MVGTPKKWTSNLWKQPYASWQKMNTMVVDVTPVTLSCEVHSTATAWQIVLHHDDLVSPVRLCKCLAQPFKLIPSREVSSQGKWAGAGPGLIGGNCFVACLFDPCPKVHPPVICGVSPVGKEVKFPSRSAPWNNGKWIWQL